MPVNSDGTYQCEDPCLTIDTGGTPVELKVAATSFGIVAENNYADHPRTGGGRPYKQLIDATYEALMKYMQGFGTDGIFTEFESRAGTEVDCLFETKDGTVSAEFPTFSFTIDVPYLSPLDDTEIGEFATGEVTIPVKGGYVKATS